VSDDTNGSASIGYDEFGLLHENATEAGLGFDPAAPPTVERVWIRDTPSGNDLSAIVWGDAAPQLVLLHGGAQNAHTWDSVALALDLPLVAIDLPGHGHSAWRPDADYRPQAMADDIAHVIATVAPDATTLIGMSLGGLTALATLAAHPDVADRLVLVDITPGVDQDKAAPIIAFVDGPEEFESFDAILERTLAFNPSRSRSSLARGVRHNAYERPDGVWSWRYDRPTEARIGDLQTLHGNLWDALAELDQPLLLVQGGLSGVVDDDDIAELHRRRPDAEVVVVEEAGHSVQGDRPVVLADLVRTFHG
jgi:pimeloyl-ACP methyl ester carboxylesterase